VESELITRLLEPEPRLKEGRALAKSRSVTAMMDNSDGLALSLSDLSEVSGVGFSVFQDKLPLAPGLVEMVGEEMALQMALGAGGDFELAFTLRPSGLQTAREACSLTVIGEVVEEGIWMEREGERREIVGKGYEHRIGIQGNQLQS
jgi:thiamine-monophosphate kinase